MRHATAFLASAALVAGSIGFSLPARAADDLGSNPVKELLDAVGLGSGKEKPDIDYRERAALVPPSSTLTLPPPQQKGAVGQATGQWPLDPDEERRAKQRAEDNLPRTEQRDYKLDRNPRLSPAEIGGRRLQPEDEGVAGYAEPAVPYNDRPSRLSPAELERRKSTAQASATVPGVEPSRKRLTDPPEGYRAPSATAPYAAPEEAAKKPWYKKINPFSRD